MLGRMPVAGQPVRGCQRGSPHDRIRCLDRPAAEPPERRAKRSDACQRARLSVTSSIEARTGLGGLPPSASAAGVSGQSTSRECWTGAPNAGIVGRMRSAEFYSLAAQVLPTLLIAVMIEIRFVARALADADWQRVRQGSSFEDLAPDGQVFNLVRPYFRWHRPLVYLGWLFVLGELGSLAVVFLGPKGWLLVLAAPFVVVASVGLTVLAVVTLFRAFAIEQQRAFDQRFELSHNEDGSVTVFIKDPENGREMSVRGFVDIGSASQRDLPDEASSG